MVKDHGHRLPPSFIWIITFFNGAFGYGNGAKYSGYAGKNTEPLYAEFCNFVQFHAFVNYLTHYY
jgi:hypothetical protein